MILLPHISTLFPYTTLFRSKRRKIERPTRKKSSAQGRNASAHDRRGQRVCVGPDRDHDERCPCRAATPMPTPVIDRKSTRLNSSHTVISYAVFCLKKKKKNK